ncbi:aspartokinase 2, chloroplastic-like [Magnolia sinica]|uniref:aspartokinase 2, chloroplastic-like n=1 Tax=Magnolia sinica TaxID=86752 RepID=UPI002659A3E0|nr:aspartokinase 2, chloroplastic-like [Magnolia sinica]
MAAGLSFGGIETPYAGFRTNLLSSASNLLSSASVAPPARILVGWATLRCSCVRGATFVVEKSKTVQSPNGSVGQLSRVMKFDGSSVASAKRMREVAELILSIPKERPVIVLSAMEKTTNRLRWAGEKAIDCGASNVSNIDELRSIKELHLKTIDELGVDRSTISPLLDELEQGLKGIAIMKEMTRRSKDYLVSFGECMSTRIFAAYLNKIGVKARQYDAYDIGFITTDAFTNADILEATYPAVAERLHGDWISDPAIPVVTGSLGKGQKSCAVTTLGKGGSDLTATAIGKALGLREIQVWKYGDGFLTCNPNIYPHAEPVPYLTFDEVAELAYFGVQVLHPRSMRPAREADIPVRVKNFCNPKAPGTLITRDRDISKIVLTSIAVKRSVTVLDIKSTRAVGQNDFFKKVFSIFEKLGISVDEVATSEVSILLTLDPSKLFRRESIQQQASIGLLDRAVEELKKIAEVNHIQRRSIISLIGNVQHSPQTLNKVFSVLTDEGISFQKINQGSSKVNISLIVNDSETEQCVRALHSTFFEMGVLSEINIADAFQNGYAVLAGSSRETKTVEMSASASHMPDCGSASTSHVLDSNAIPSNMPDQRQLCLTFS